MNQEIKLLDVVALLRAMPAENLKKGQVGTVVEVFSEEDFEVEFADKHGKTIAMVPLKNSDLLVLQYELERA
jgi:ABC-type nitrate/sulfonate/bicarbonate transport system substrate-binding protein